MHTGPVHTSFVRNPNPARALRAHPSGRKKTDPSATGQPCSVRLHGDVVVSYCLSEVGGHRTRLVHEDPPRRYDKLFYLYDPDAFFQSRSSCRDIIHQMLAQTPVVGDLDLAAGNWDEDHFLPHDVATMIHARSSWLPFNKRLCASKDAEAGGTPPF